MLQKVLEQAKRSVAKPPAYYPPRKDNPPITIQPSKYDVLFEAPHPSLIPPQNDWMTVPYGIVGCPPGLEYLTTIDKLLVHQKVELLETITGFDSNNKYTIKNSLGQKVYLALEDSNWFNRMGGPMRPFEIKILSNFGNEIIRLRRPFACHACVCPFWLQQLFVDSPPGMPAGSVVQEWSFLRPQYLVKNAIGETVLKIKGPTCRFSFAVEFVVYSKDGKVEVGKITKHWSGLAREIFTDADYFGISFPMDLDVKIKAVLLGACFLIDFMFFED